LAGCYEGNSTGSVVHFCHEINPANKQGRAEEASLADYKQVHDALLLVIIG
jgi:hypothetical protein